MTSRRQALLIVAEHHAFVPGDDSVTDFVRLAGKEFRSNPLLERAFGEGYGSDPRESEEWRRHRLREAVGTAVWAYQVGDEDFEAHGHGLLAELMT